MKKVVFLCGIWSKDEEQSYIQKSKKGMQNAANVLQTSIISGLDQLCEQPPVLINEVFIGAYPKLYTDLFINGGEFNHSSVLGHKDFKVEFLNLPYLKHLSRYYQSRKYIRKACKSDDEIILLGYSMTFSIVKGLLYAKKVNPRVKTCLIVPDLPEFMNMSANKSLIFRFVKSINQKSIYKKIKGIDAFVLLTEHMYSKLGCNKPYLVMEGIATNSMTAMDCDKKRNNSVREIVYTGSLAKKYGICELVDAFTSIDYDDLRLVICGDGDGVPYIEEAAKNDPRISYLGMVSHSEALAYQRNAYILVNPRNSKEEYTKYSFPSKTMEYMSTGNALVMYKLDGIPEEYGQHIFFCNDNIEETLKYVLAKPQVEIKEFGAAAKEFVMSQKNEKVQVNRILKFMDGIL